LMGLNLRNIMPPCLKNSKNERLGLKIEYCSRCSPFHSLVNHRSVSMITRCCSALSGNRRLTWLAQGYVLAMLEDVQWIYLREKLGLQPLCINRWWSFYRSILFIFNIIQLIPSAKMGCGSLSPCQALGIIRVDSQNNMSYHTPRTV
jgi:hypothetical protein